VGGQGTNEYGKTGGVEDGTFPELVGHPDCHLPLEKNFSSTKTKREIP
jgi:hypothetical protein